MPESSSPFFQWRSWYNPLALGRLTWLLGRRGWAKLWRAPGDNARFLTATAFFFSGAMALTEPYKALYLSKLGLSNLAIGGFFALDMGLRVLGVLLGGIFAQRWGHKRTLLVVDFISCTVPFIVLALATEPWHVYLATCLTATNALLAGSVIQLLVEGTPEENRTSLFAVWTLVFVMPLFLLPGMAGWAVERWGVLPSMRVFFGVGAVSTLVGILWRRVRLKESLALRPKADLAELLSEALAAGQHLLKQRFFWPVLGSFLVGNSIGNLARVYQGLYITKSMGMSDGLVGTMTTVGAAAFILASLFWVPRLKPGKDGQVLFWLSILGMIPGLGLAFTDEPWVVMVLGGLGGLFGATYGAILTGRVADLLPKGQEGLAHALLLCLMQAAVALSLVLGGALFETRFGAYPWVVGLLPLLQAGLAWQMLRKA